MMMQYNPVELLDMQSGALYVQDEQQRLIRVNEPDPEEPAPRFFLSRSLTGHIWRIRQDVEAGSAAELERLAASEPPLQTWQDQPRHINPYRHLLQQQAPVTQENSGPSYYVAQSDAASQAVVITPATAGLLQEHFPYTASHLSVRAPVAVKVEDGTAVSACYTVRITPQAVEAGVDTVEAYRGRGYAVEVTRAWAAAVWATGKVPLYSTEWSNIASQAVARKVGTIQYGSWFHLT